MSLKERKYLYKTVGVDGNKELDFFTPSFIELDVDSSTTFVIPTVMEYRPDLISMRFYGNYHMGWLIALHNDYLDPVFDFKQGNRISIPDMDEYFRYYKARSHRRS